MIKYPNGMRKIPETIRVIKNKNVKKANLGTDFETKINESNEYYLQKNIASIHKKPTPVQIVKVDYPSRNKARIVEAYYKTPSTTDYNGIYKGYHIDFEAKCCRSTSFSFNHIFPHQINHLMKVDEMGGISFLIIEFPEHQEVFIMPAKILYEKYYASLSGGKKSISYKEFKEEAYSVKEGFNPWIEYIPIVDILIENKKIQNQ